MTARVQGFWKSLAKALARALPALVAAALALPAAAQEVTECDWRATPDAIPEPWEAHSRSFANGNVRLALLDAIEPAAGAFHLLVLSPPFDSLGARQCRIVGFDGTRGFAALDFAALAAAYDPATGLTFRLPGRLWLPEQDFTNALILIVTVNQATGAVTARTELGGE